MSFELVQVSKILFIRLKITKFNDIYIYKNHRCKFIRMNLDSDLFVSLLYKISLNNNMIDIIFFQEYHGSILIKRRRLTHKHD